MSLLDDFLGRPLASREAESERINALMGVPILGLDALASASYGPEAALTILLPAGIIGVAYMPGVIVAIIVLLLLVYFSYRQTIAAYPNGGGSYTVAKENLGVNAGLFAAASLMIDYILNVAVAISAGVGALVSAVPVLQGHILLVCLLILVVMTVVNLRGIRTTGLAWSLPTIVFVFSLFVVIGVGVYRTCAGAGHPHPVEAPPGIPTATTGVGLWLLLRAFASGCTAMTGVEAVSNGVPLFAEPTVKNAQRSLTIIIACLSIALIGIGYLAHTYHIAAMDQTRPGYQSVISQLVAAVLGRNPVYYLILGSVITVLALSANTSFTGFPRLCRLLAEDRYLPSAFANLGRRLVYSIGIMILAILTSVILIFCDGITDKLIPLFAVGAFSAFTFSQAGMVMHWLRHRCAGWRHSLAINAVGAMATSVALLIILVTKFTEGAWATICAIPALLLIFHGVKKHYRRIEEDLTPHTPLDLSDISESLVILPINGWNNLTAKGVRFALRMSRDITAVHISDTEENADLRRQWAEQVEAPSQAAGIQPPHLEIVVSSYRQLFRPVLDVVRRKKEENPDRVIAVIVPELVYRNWYEYILHSHRASVFKFFLLSEGDDRTVVITTPWFLHAPLASRLAADRRKLSAHDTKAGALPGVPA